MRYLFGIVLLAIMLPASTLRLAAQESEGQYIEWTGENEVANAFVNHGIWFMMNWENDKAVSMFQSALHEDPTLFAPHVVLSNFTSGEVREQHIAKAKALVEGHSEVSQLFVSLTDLEPGDQEGAAKVWAEMREKASAEARLVHFFYAITRNDPAESKSELESLLELINEQETNGAHVHNILGYMEMRQGNMEAAKAHFDQYVELYPEGYNPYDSMGEYYLTAGDHQKSLEMYQMATAIHPGATNAAEKVEEIEAMMAGMHGRLILVNTEYVHPEHFADYHAWGMEYKAAAEADGFGGFWVSAGANNSYSYAVEVGNTLEDLAEYKLYWRKWATTEKLSDMYEKYKHSVSHSTEQLWRQSMDQSYTPEDYDWSQELSYVRTFKGFVKYGHESAVEELMAEMSDLASEHSIAHPWQFYWNVYGEEGPCMGIRMMYPDKAAWVASDNEMWEKIGEETMREMNQRMGSHMRHFEESEVYPSEELSHQPAPNP